MRKIKKCLLFKIIAISLSMCIFVHTLGYAAPCLRVPSMYGKVNGGNQSTERGEELMGEVRHSDEIKEKVKAIASLGTKKIKMGVTTNLASGQGVEEAMRGAFEKELGLEGNMIALEEVLKEYALFPFKSNPCYVVKDLERLTGVRYFTEPGRASYRTRNFIFKDANRLTAYGEYDHNLPFARQGLMAIPIGFIYDKKEKRSYFVEEYIEYSVEDAFRRSDTEEKEKLIEKLGKFVKRLYDMNMEPLPTDFRDPGHIRVRENGEIVVTDAYFEGLTKPKDLEDFNAYTDIRYEIIPDLLGYGEKEEIQRLREIFDKAVRESVINAKLGKNRESIDACN